MPFGPFKPVVVFPYVPPPPPAPLRNIAWRFKFAPQPRQHRRRPFYVLRRLPRVKPAAPLGPRVKLARSPVTSMARRKVTGAGKSKLSPPTVVN